MGTDEQKQEIGQAFLDRKAASQQLKCLELKLRKVRQALGYVFQASAGIDAFQTLEADDLAHYPSRDDVLALASEIGSVRQEIEFLDKKLS